jgi:hypothetical protein
MNQYFVYIMASEQNVYISVYYETCGEQPTPQTYGIVIPAQAGIQAY